MEMGFNSFGSFLNRKKRSIHRFGLSIFFMYTVIGALLFLVTISIMAASR